MARFKFFAGETELTNVCYRGAETVKGYQGKKDCLAGIDPASPPVYVAGIGWTGYVKVDRSINYKSFPSKHECDARCMNATGRTMQCECACGGKNHGRASFTCEAI